MNYNNYFDKVFKKNNLKSIKQKKRIQDNIKKRV